MDSRPNTNSFEIGEAGKPSPMVQRSINQHRLRKPFHEPSTLSSDNDNTGGGVSLLSYEPEAKLVTAAPARRATITPDVAGATSANAAALKDKGHKSNLSLSSISIQQRAPEGSRARVGASDRGRAATKADDNSGGVKQEVKKPKITDYFTPTKAAGKHQKQATKPSVKSNLTASAKAFVPKSAQDAKDAAPKLPGSASSPQLYNHVDANKPAGEISANVGSDDDSSDIITFSPAHKDERRDAFASQFDDSYKPSGLTRPANSDGACTPVDLQSSRQLFGSASPTKMAAAPTTITATSSPTRGRGLGFTGNGLLDAINSQRSRSGSVTSSFVDQQQQSQGTSASVASWVKHRVANHSPLRPSGITTQTGDNHGTQGSGPLPPIAKVGQASQVIPVRSTQMTTAYGGQYSPTHHSPSRLRGLDGRTPIINPGISYNREHVQHRRIKSKATEEDLAKCREHLVKFATQSPLAKSITATAVATANYSPTRIDAPPGQYRAGLPGSASEGALSRYTKRQPITPTRHGDNKGNDQVMIAPALAPAIAPAPPVVSTYSAINEDEVVFQAPSEEVRKMRSPQLNELVGASGAPSLRGLRGPLFPFEPCGGMKAKRGEGVIRFFNVSSPSSFVSNSLCVPVLSYATGSSAASVCQLANRPSSTVSVDPFRPPPLHSFVTPR